MKKILILITMIMLLLSCSKTENKNGENKEIVKDVQVIKNSLDPADPSLTIAPKLLFTIKATEEDGTENFQRVQQVSIAPDGSFFAVDPGSYSVKKFGKDGNFLLSFGKQGNGPGEFTMLNTGLAILNEKVIIPDPMSQGVKIFDMDGKFIESVNTMMLGTGMIIMPEAFTENEMLGLTTSVEQKDGKIALNNKLAVFTDSLTVKSIVWNKEEIFDPTDMGDVMSMGNDFPSYTAGAGIIYMSTAGTDKYSIKAIDPSGKELYKITMPYRKIRYTEDELKEINEKMKSYADPAAQQFMKDFKFEEKFKKVVNAMYVDSKDRLWVEKAFESTGEKDLRKLDIFIKGVYQNTIDLKDDNGNNIKGIIKLKDNRMYAVDFEDNKISVYEF